MFRERERESMRKKILSFFFASNIVFDENEKMIILANDGGGRERI